MIICCGESLIDMLPAELNDGKPGFRPVPGGSIYNTAIALGRLEQPVGFLAGISKDIFGDDLMANMRDSGVSTTYITRKNNPTTMAYVKLENGLPSYSFNDENSAARSLTTTDLKMDFSNLAAIHFGGFSLATEPCGSTYEEFVVSMKPEVVISFDPNIRTALIVDEKHYRERLQRLLGESDIIKISEEDLAWMAPGENFQNGENFENLAKDWIAAGAAIVMLTKGKQGTLAITRDEKMEVPAIDTKVVDTVGAGDTFNAGFLAKLNELACLDKHKISNLDQNILQTALGYAAKAASYTVSQAGATAPRKNQII